MCKTIVCSIAFIYFTSRNKYQQYFGEPEGRVKIRLAILDSSK